MWIDYPSVIRESEEELRTLERQHRSTPRLLRRIQMLRLLKSGACRSMIRAAPILDYSVPQLERWWRIYREGGVELLLNQRSIGGSSERMTPDAWEGLHAELEAGRIRTLEQARHYLWEKWGIEYKSVGGVSGLFRRHGIKWKTGRRHHRKTDAAAQAAFKQTSLPGYGSAASRVYCA